ncbi:hypothetical protein PCK1_001186 [Pneumocystis canis]|nr:hypothetical protein PCK1_001186 [Pneumocystis canis]
MTNIEFHIPPLCLKDNINKIRLDFIASYKVFYSDKNASSYWKKYDIIKGDDLNLKLTALWNNNYLEQDFINNLCQLISSADVLNPLFLYYISDNIKKIWKQIHIRPIILQSNDTKNSITLNLLPSQSYPILHYSKNILHGKLLEIQIILDFKDISYKNSQSNWMPKFEVLIPLTDLAFRSLFKDKLSQNIPLIFRIIEKTSQHLNNISRSLERISKRSTRTSLQKKFYSLKKISLQDSCFLTQELWNTVKRAVLFKKTITELKPALNHTYALKLSQKGTHIDNDIDISLFPTNDDEYTSYEDDLLQILSPKINKSLKNIPLIQKITNVIYIFFYKFQTKYLKYEGGKFSKSRGVGVFGHNVQEIDVSPSVWRYYLLVSRPEGSDTVFSWNEFIQRNNGELLANLGNFVNRVIKFVNMKYDNIIPNYIEYHDESKDGLIFLELKRDINQILAHYIENMDAVKIRSSLRLVLEFSARGNLFLQSNKLNNTLFDNNPQKCADVIGYMINLIYLISACMAPFMPSKAKCIIEQLNVPEKCISDTWDFDILPGHKINKAQYLFVKIDEKMGEVWRKKFGGLTSSI